MTREREMLRLALRERDEARSERDALRKECKRLGSDCVALCKERDAAKDAERDARANQSVRPPDPPHCRCTIIPQAAPGRTAASLAEENAALRVLVRVLLEAKP